MRGHVAVLLAVSLALVESEHPATESAPQTTVRFVAERPGEVVVPVFVGGRGPYRFLIDTGSTHTAVSEALARTLAATPVARAPLATSAGSIMCVVVRLTDVAIGSASAANILATVLPAAGATVLGREIDGVIGQDFLSHYDYTIDYGGARLLWNDRVEDRPGVRLALVPSGGRFLVELPQAGNGQESTVRFVPDSGAEGLLLFDSGARRLPIEESRASQRLGSLAGEREARTVVVRSLRVGAVRLREQSAILVSAHPAGGEINGLLPLHLFASVSFNNHDGYMVVRAW